LLENRQGEVMRKIPGGKRVLKTKEEDLKGEWFKKRLWKRAPIKKKDRPVRGGNGGGGPGKTRHQRSMKLNQDLCRFHLGIKPW